MYFYSRTVQGQVGEGAGWCVHPPSQCCVGQTTTTLFLTDLGQQSVQIRMLCGCTGCGDSLTKAIHPSHVRTAPYRSKWRPRPAPSLSFKVECLSRAFRGSHSPWVLLRFVNGVSTRDLYKRVRVRDDGGSGRLPLPYGCIRPRLMKKRPSGPQ